MSPGELLYLAALTMAVAACYLDMWRYRRKLKQR
jgi:hypothetical protein